MTREELKLLWDKIKSTYALRLYESTDSLSYKVLTKNEKFIDLVIKNNTIYVILDKFTVPGEVHLPKDSVLQFNGGNISNATLVGNNTIINAQKIKIFDSNTVLSGDWNVKEFYPEWWGAKGDGITNDGPAFQAMFNSILNIGKGRIVLNPKTYNLEYYTFTTDGAYDPKEEKWKQVKTYKRSFKCIADVEIVGYGDRSILHLINGANLEFGTIDEWKTDNPNGSWHVLQNKTGTDDVHLPEIYDPNDPSTEINGGARKGDTVIKVSDASVFKVDEIYIIKDIVDFSFDNTRLYYKQGEYIKIRAIDTEHNTITVYNPLYGNYGTLLTKGAFTEDTNTTSISDPGYKLTIKYYNRYGKNVIDGTAPYNKWGYIARASGSKIVPMIVPINNGGTIVETTVEKRMARDTFVSNAFCTTFRKQTVSEVPVFYKRENYDTVEKALAAYIKYVNDLKTFLNNENEFFKHRTIFVKPNLHIYNLHDFKVISNIDYNNTERNIRIETVNGRKQIVREITIVNKKTIYGDIIYTDIIIPAYSLNIQFALNSELKNIKLYNTESSSKGAAIGSAYNFKIIGCTVVSDMTRSTSDSYGLAIHNVLHGLVSDCTFGGYSHSIATGTGNTIYGTVNRDYIIEKLHFELPYDERLEPRKSTTITFDNHQGAEYYTYRDIYAPNCVCDTGGYYVTIENCTLKYISTSFHRAGMTVRNCRVNYIGYATGKRVVTVQKDGKDVEEEICKPTYKPGLLAYNNPWHDYSNDEMIIENNEVEHYIGFNAQSWYGKLKNLIIRNNSIKNGRIYLRFPQAMNVVIENNIISETNIPVTLIDGSTAEIGQTFTINNVKDGNTYKTKTFGPFDEDDSLIYIADRHPNPDAFNVGEEIEIGDDGNQLYEDVEISSNVVQSWDLSVYKAFEKYTLADTNYYIRNNILNNNRKMLPERNGSGIYEVIQFWKKADNTSKEQSDNFEIEGNIINSNITFDNIVSDTPSSTIVEDVLPYQWTVNYVAPKLTYTIRIALCKNCNIHNNTIKANGNIFYISSVSGDLSRNTLEYKDVQYISKKVYNTNSSEFDPYYNGESTKTTKTLNPSALTLTRNYDIPGLLRVTDDNVILSDNLKYFFGDTDYKYGYFKEVLNIYTIERDGLDPLKITRNEYKWIRPTYGTIYYIEDLVSSFGPWVLRPTNMTIGTSLSNPKTFKYYDWSLGDYVYWRSYYWATGSNYYHASRNSGTATNMPVTLWISQNMNSDFRTTYINHVFNGMAKSDGGECYMRTSTNANTNYSWINENQIEGVAFTVTDNGQTYSVSGIIPPAHTLGPNNPTLPWNDPNVTPDNVYIGFVYSYEAQSTNLRLYFRVTSIIDNGSNKEIIWSYVDPYEFVLYSIDRGFIYFDIQAKKYLLLIEVGKTYVSRWINLGNNMVSGNPSEIQLPTAVGVGDIVYDARTGMSKVPYWWDGNNWISKVKEAESTIGMNTYTTDTMPTIGLVIGQCVFNTTLGKALWYNGTNWVDANGTILLT